MTISSLWRRITRVPRQLLGVSPFDGDLRPRRVPLFRPWSGRPSLPFPHPWNYDRPIRILETFFHGADAEQGGGRHTRYLDVPGFAPILVTRDPAVIRAVTTETGDQPGQFDRDTLPSDGIARATGSDTLLYANGPLWRHQRKLAAPPFGKTSLFQPEVFHEFEESFRRTIASRLDALRAHLQACGTASAEVRLEPEIKAVMLELLTNNFFGASIGYDELRNVHVPALERIIDHIVRDTVLSRLGFVKRLFPGARRRAAQVRDDAAAFDRLTDLMLASRRDGKGMWRQFRSDAPDEALRSNLKVFLAGALEATTSFACWAVAHLARHPAAQQRVFEEVRGVDHYTPDDVRRAEYLGHVLEETLRLTPSLYFLPRRATADTWIECADGRRLRVPAGTHLLLDVWHANRHEDHWGVEPTGFPARDFAPERWENLKKSGRATRDFLHFGFGHGPRVCPGKHLGQLEVELVVGALVKLFHLEAAASDVEPFAGVSTRPADGTVVRLTIRPVARATG